MRTTTSILFFCLSALAHAAPDCGVDNGVGMDQPDMGPRHHPVGQPLPRGREFHQPDGCLDGVWLYDRNRNGLSDPGEIRLYGPNRVIACASCHGDSPDMEATGTANVFLRQRPSTLCLACHNY